MTISILNYKYKGETLIKNSTKGISTGNKYLIIFFFCDNNISVKENVRENPECQGILNFNVNPVLFYRRIDT